MKSTKGHLSCLVIALSVSGGVVAEDLNEHNRSDYIARERANHFKQKTNIHTALCALNRSERFEADSLFKSDKSKLSNWQQFDFRRLMPASYDNGNQYTVRCMRKALHPISDLADNQIAVILNEPDHVENIDEAHEFTNYLFAPTVRADISNDVAYANPKALSTLFTGRDMAGDSGSYS